jgi:hypothetical protein
MPLCLERSFKSCSKGIFLSAAATAALLAGTLTYAASVQTSPPDEPGTHQLSSAPSSAGRLYIFRPIRPFGAHIDDDVTVNGLPVHRLAPGTGFYCDLAPGDYLIAVARHKTKALKVSMEAGQKQFVCVMLHNADGVAPRGGGLTSDQSFDVRLLAPDYAVHRVQEYPLTRANCQH